MNSSGQGSSSERSTAHQRVPTSVWKRIGGEPEERIYVGIGGFAVTRRPGAALQTMALGSCVGLMLIDRVARAVGMVHVALPESDSDIERALAEPGRYADTGVPALIRAMQRQGGSQGPHSCEAKIAGGACVLGDHGLFNIGVRNAEAVLTQCRLHGLKVTGRDIGGGHSRTVVIDVDHLRVVLTSPAREPWEI